MFYLIGFIFLYFYFVSVFFKLKFSGVFHLLLLTYLIILIGTRFEIGPDWMVYQWIYEDSCKNLEFLFGPGDYVYNLINCLSLYLNYGILFVNIVCAVIVVIGSYLFAKLCYKPYIFYISALPYYLYIVSMGYTRQSVAISLFMIANYYFLNRKFHQGFFSFLVGVGVHKTLFFVFIPLMTRIFKVRYTFFIITLLLLFVILFVDFQTSYFEYLKLNYLDGDMSSSGAFSRTLFSLICTFAYFYKVKRILNKNISNFFDLFAILPIVYILFLTLWPEQSTAIDRLGLYQLPFNFIIISYIFSFAKNKISLFNYINLYFVINLFYFFTWLYISNFRDAWYPYKSFLFELL